MSALSRRDRRALWVGALLVVPVLAWRVVIAPLSASMTDAQNQAAATVQLLARELTLLRDGPDLPRQLALAQRRLDEAATQLFIARDTLDASAALATWLRGTARSAHLDDVRIESAPTAVASGVLVAAAADITARGSTAALTRWLAAVEQGDRLVALERVEIVANADGTLAISARAHGLARRGLP